MAGLQVVRGAFLAAAMASLAAPPAHADVVDSIIDPIINSVQAGLTGLDPFAGLSGLDVGSVGAADSALAAASDSSSVAATLDSVLHGLEQGWIASALGAEVDKGVNGLWQDVGGSGILIGNGANGVPDGTLAAAHGGAGGLVFGDGGDGATDAAGQGGAGGAAGLFGDGGAGGNGADGTVGVAGGDGGTGGAGGTVIGDGGAGGDGGIGGGGAAGGAGGAGGNAVGLLGTGGHGGDGGDGGAGGVGGNGGDGGNGVGLFVNGGNGGNGGDGSNPDGLPALGGAGGNGSMLGVLGSHGAVGQYGMLTGAASGGQVQTTGADGVLPVGTTGTWLTNSAGQVVMLHGLNEVYKLPPYEPAASGFGNNDAAFLAANGFNVVRLGVIWAGVEPEPGVINYAYLASIEQTVQTLASHGIYVVIDMHQDLYSTTFAGEGAPTWAVQTGGLPNIDAGFPNSYFLNPAESHAWDAFWSNAPAPNGVGLENNYAQMYEVVANYFNGNPDVAGFEVMNEPWPGALFLPTLFGSPAFDTQDLTPFYDQAASAIRAVDPTTPVFFEPNVLFNNGVPTHLGTVDSPNTVFAFHDYCIVESLTGSSAFCGLLDGITTAHAEAYSRAHDIPAFMTEFGANDNSVIADTMQSAKQRLFGWTEWAYTGQGDITGSPNTEWLVFNPHDPPVGANVDTAKLATLAQPYPQVVSGTPDSWSFDNGTFTFSYSTDKVDGAGSFSAGSQTTISVPKIEFPNGYQVSVTGGQVVSATNSPDLVIASDAGANTVSVTVSPAAGG